MNNQSKLSHRKCEPEQSTLYLVGTPIGNLTDISQRAINILRNVNLIACEDTRVTLKFLNHLELTNRLISFHAHNYTSRFEIILNELREGNSIALVSDAGMPLISDPGELLVKVVKSNNFDVICVPGPCAAITALVSSGLPTSNFTFYGFLPKNGKERERVLNSIHNNLFTSIVYESPKRIRRFLSEINDLCGGEREISVLRELTKKYEQNIGTNISEVMKYFEKVEPKGEFTLIIKGCERSEINDDSEINNIKEDLIYLTNSGLSHSKASFYLARKYNISKNRIYNLLL
tara:strand:- start:2671 stop:3540 length:870 start_codon:yes stop_codon:yes gene_type:complete